MANDLFAKCRSEMPKRTTTMEFIDIHLVNDEGEKDSVEIDIADNELQQQQQQQQQLGTAAPPSSATSANSGPPTLKKEEKNLANARRQSINDRISRRRTSELAAEIIRLSAENRRKEFIDLLNEHNEIVKSINNWQNPGHGDTGKLAKKRANSPFSQLTSYLSTVESVDDEAEPVTAALAVADLSSSARQTSK